MSHYQNRVQAGKINPAAGINPAIDDQIDETLARIMVIVQEKSGQGTSKAMLASLERFEDALVASTDLQSLLTGTTQGKQPLALGAGSPVQGQPPTQDQIDAALQVIGDALTARGPGYENQAKLIRAALAPKTDPAFVEADSNGRPKAVADLQQQVNAGRSDRDLLDIVVTQMGHTPVASDEHYPVPQWSKTITDSLKARLDPAQAVSKTDLAAAVRDAKAKVAAITGGIRPGIVNGKDEAVTELEKLEQLAQ